MYITTLLSRETSITNNSMASVSPSYSSISGLSGVHDRSDLESIRVLVFSVNQYIFELIANAETWNCLKLKCNSRLNIQKQEFFEFSEQAVLSNLYWGIDSIEAAFQAKWPEEKTSRLSNSEKMLQVPALLDEHGVTAGISNDYLISCSYFYLSVVKSLQADQWQAALHFLQAVLVSPTHVRTEFVPELCEILFPPSVSCDISEMNGRKQLQYVSVKNSGGNDINKLMVQMARRYKHWLMYYQVMLCEKTTHSQSGCKSILSPAFESEYLMNKHEISTITESSKLNDHGNSLRTYCKYEKVNPLEPQEDAIHGMTDGSKASSTVQENHVCTKAIKELDQISRLQPQNSVLDRNSGTKYLKDMLKESQSDTATSVDSWGIDFEEENDLEATMEETESLKDSTKLNENDHGQATCDQQLDPPCYISGPECTEIMLLQTSGHPIEGEVSKANIRNYHSGRLLRTISDLSFPVLEVGEKGEKTFCYLEDVKMLSLQPHEVQLFEHIAPTSLQSRRVAQMNQEGTAVRKKQNSCRREEYNEVCTLSRKDSKSELLKIIENALSKLCFSDALGKSVDDYAIEITAIFNMLNTKKGVKYSMLKDVILDQLVTAISTSKKEMVMRTSVFTLASIVSANCSVIDYIKKKGLQLSDLARALKENVHEAAILIYLIKPSPKEIRTLELLPTLMEVICTSYSYKCSLKSVLLTPAAASLMIIEVLVTAFDNDTNKTTLAAINSPSVLSGLLDVARIHNLEVYVSLATVLIACMQFDGRCRKYISQAIPVAPFIQLLQSDEKRAICIALGFFHEILQIPRSSAISLLHRICKEGSIDIMQILMHQLQELQPDYQLLAASLLLELDTLENSSGKTVFGEAAMGVLLTSLASEENSSTQILSAFILSNIGGTYSWTGDPYTIGWLVKKAGLTSLHHRNMIRNFDWMDLSLQDVEVDSWCNKIARRMIEIGKPVFDALEKGLKSKTKRVSRDSLTAIAWLGCEIAKSSTSLRYSACEILLAEIQKFLHPGFELEERFLACLSIYNYASGKGMKKLIHFSEGVWESLRRFSNVTWMAEELHKVADYCLPNRTRISCVHTQTLEASKKHSGAVTALIYYKGLLFSGHSDGSIKVWDIKHQSASLLWDIKEHKKAVTCFSLFEPGDSLLSGSADKTIRVWQMVQRKLDCIEVIGTKEPIRKLDTYGKMIFMITQSHRLKGIDSSRKAKNICKSKNVKSMRVIQGRIYAGCMDSSIQELPMTGNNEREIKAPAKSWRLQTKPINSIVVYKDWLYSASSLVHGSNVKEWRRQCESQMTILLGKGTNILAMEVVEDFLYLNCSSSTSTLQIWLRETQQKVGRISAGSKITSLLTANDTVLCGTETGLIKGWIPL
ncbi:hypothetical protein SLEP1_g40169 [Rubroshorea leprosula]|uniref:E3 ubiquitin-protein ligase LIN-1 n=1 Tax=Rubroshorea leprosula TaxID=152421 RepID=A0AAV5L2U9_9ROSI|nr:hypothetical protein SLEP1_g40169 [Rubroshorea leprosula]